MSVTLLALARFTLKGPYQAASVIAMLAILAVFLPLVLPAPIFGTALATVFTSLSCVLVGVIILTQGTVSGLRVIAVSVAGITLIGWLVVDVPELGLWTALVQWLPIVALAQTLRSSNSLALTLLLGVLIAALGIVVQYSNWQGLEADLVNQALQRMQQLEQMQPELVERNVQLIRLFVLALVSMAYLIFILTVLCARWMQAGLVDSDGFGKEFRALTLGKPTAMAAVVLVLLSIWLQQPWMNSIAFLVTILFMFQGLAIVHSKLAQKKLNGLIFGLFYAMLLMIPQVVALTAITGVIDNWLVFRKNSDDQNGLNKL